MRYIALLRGVNFGGKNKISMAELKTAFENSGFQNVKTYIKSGNVVFESDLSETEMQSICCKLIEKEFGLKISVAVIGQEELAGALAAAPDWWGNLPNSIHNAVFVIEPAVPAEIMAKLANATDENEKAVGIGKIIFWTALEANFYNTKTAKVIHGKGLYECVTVRNANTTRKLAELSS